MQEQVRTTNIWRFFTHFPGSLPVSPPRIQLFALCMYLIFLCAVLFSCVLYPMFYSLLHAGSTPILRGRAYFHVVWRLSDFEIDFCFMHWSEGSVLFHLSLTCLVLIISCRKDANRVIFILFSGKLRSCRSSAELNSIQSTTSSMVVFLSWYDWYEFTHSFRFLICARTRACHRQTNRDWDPHGPHRTHWRT